MTLIERVIAARKEVVSQLPHGVALSEAQQAEILIAQVNAIISGPPASVAETPPVTEEPKE
jgi:hypothetical protein